MGKKLNKEIRKASFRITKEIQNHAKPRKYDWLVFFASLLSILFSICTIFISVQIPKQIAEQQNSIALFEKRYEVYHELKIINDFINNYYSTSADAIKFLPIENLDELSQEQLEGIYYKSLWEGEIQKNQYSNNDDVGNILKLQSQIIDSLSLVFYDITCDEEALCKEFFNTYNAMTQNYVQVNNADIIVYFSEPDKDYKQIDLTDLLKKMEKQLKL